MHRAGSHVYLVKDTSAPHRLEGRRAAERCLTCPLAGPREPPNRCGSVLPPTFEGCSGAAAARSLLPHPRLFRIRDDSNRGPRCSAYACGCRGSNRSRGRPRRRQSLASGPSPRPRNPVPAGLGIAQAGAALGCSASPLATAPRDFRERTLGSPADPVSRHDRLPPAVSTRPGCLHGHFLTRSPNRCSGRHRPARRVSARGVSGLQDLVPSLSQISADRTAHALGEPPEGAGKGGCARRVERAQNRTRVREAIRGCGLVLFALCSACISYHSEFGGRHSFYLALFHTQSLC